MNNSRKGIKKTAKKSEVYIEWVGGKLEGKFCFALVEAFDKDGELQYKKKIIATDYNLPKKYPKIRITPILIWDSHPSNAKDYEN